MLQLKLINPFVVKPRGLLEPLTTTKCLIEKIGACRPKFDWHSAPRITPR